MRAAILMYHRVASLTRDVHNLAVTPENFRTHLQYLHDNRDVIPLSQLAQDLSDGEVCDGAIALTFDDGYLDNLTNAWPLLSEFKCPATFFVTTERLLCGGAYWWDILERALFEGDLASTLELEINGRCQTYPTHNLAERRRSHDELWPILWSSRPAARDDLLRQLLDAAALDFTNLETARPMDAGEIRKLAGQPGVEIGAHSVHHLSLSNLSGQELLREVADSRSQLERILQQPVTSFAYPYGDVSGEAVEAVRIARFRVAVTVEARPLETSDPPLLLPRLQAPRGDAAELAASLPGHR